MAARSTSQSERRKTAAALRRAFAGKLKWLHQAALNAGYRRPHMAQSTAEVGKFFGVERKTVERWIKTQGCPGKTAAGYDLSAIALWMLDQARRAAERSGGNGDGDARQELYRWKARSERLRCQKAERELIPRVEHERAVHARSAFFVSNLEVLPAVGAAQGHRAKSRRELQRILKELCDSIIEMAYGTEEEGTKARRHEGT